MMPVIEIKGVKIGNFSSPHSFRFVGGEELAACTKERASGLMLNSTEVEFNNESGWTDIELKFSMSESIERALDEACSMEVDVVIVPFPVMEAVKSLGWPSKWDKVRCCRVADRVTKTVYSDRFCK